MCTSEHRSIPLSLEANVHEASTEAPQVVVTRERGKNVKLMKSLQQRGISVLELPLVETAVGPDRSELPDALTAGDHDWVIVTSPESASVFLQGWREADKPQVRLAVVGSGTGVVIEAAGEADLPVAFTPSKANAEHLSAELPLEGEGRVLYPASAKAGAGLQEGLEARGFSVRRLNTYNTVPVQSLPAADVEAAKQARVVAFASPSAVKAWLACVGDQESADVAIACIGSTSARAAEKLGLKRIYYPDSPGLEGFVVSIVEALEAAEPSAALA
ncbi:tetrapyrrole biosynthesis, uroporphyrinogen III synthase [Coccomyxa subellipsoidea C-169]|uniref:Uroporphyrinogen-III synthase n=1 Tax=Coccomyxa subellipsoidea (strain C-169) TaxID=574566 RepID=I0YS35_COCSC|nr:tetrapyrrole biosynthesis, uroporphyrinogen III synthase [Coccomyxa subellipsoidea C-169]EIE21204.1 tetrapyrrole biosynthesis, uroporphyrinogen III synthase [Coccomyxa subellipsoidea C-169]|eukprot:XP_005645748.1 tetrapyrrole biosynthesis, uroporphyrinogen III synthase [Coccomyxa subellipsoidea C-169]